MRIALLAATILSLGGCQPIAAPGGTAMPAAAMRDAALDQAIASPRRSADNRARDAYRHPYETLRFFGVEADDTLVEVNPGGAWYTEILAPYLADRGRLHVLGSRRALARVEARRDSDFAKVGLLDLDDPAALAAMAGKADAVLTFRNVHNWYMADNAGAMFRTFHALLKPGGTLGVVEHRLPEDRPDAMMRTSGYMKRSTVVALARAAGFELVGESEINANPRDTSDYPGGVWTLPPNLAEKDKDRARYLAIGESDRMTLRFRKTG